MISKLPFGRTGHNSTRALFGAVALGNITREQADETLDLLLRYGVNHIDTAASYGEAEDRLKPWLETRRDEFFLATKTTHRDYKSAREEIHRSLERMGVAQIDLIQLHNLVEKDECETAFSEQGVLRATLEARDEGLVRFIGVTGHGLETPRRHIESLNRFDFDSVLLPFNYSLMQNEQYARDFNELAALCCEREVAMQTIKSICRCPKNEDSLPRATWYEPLEEKDDIRRAVHWALGRDGIFLNAVGDIHVLPPFLEAVANFSAPPSDDEMEAIHDEKAMAPLFA